MLADRMRICSNLPRFPDKNGNIYNQGIFEERWVEGYSEGKVYADAGLIKKSDHLFMYLWNISSGTIYRTFVTDVPIDISKYNTLNIEWENLGTENSVYTAMRLAVSDNKLENYNVGSLKFFTKERRFERTIDTFDVSEITGECYIKISAYRGLTASTIGRIYRVWFE